MPDGSGKSRATDRRGFNRIHKRRFASKQNRDGKNQTTSTAMTSLSL
jgi:hypothetical protein